MEYEYQDWIEDCCFTAMNLYGEYLADNANIFKQKNPIKMHTVVDSKGTMRYCQVTNFFIVFEIKGFNIEKQFGVDVLYVALRINPWYYYSEGKNDTIDYSLWSGDNNSSVYMNNFEETQESDDIFTQSVVKSEWYNFFKSIKPKFIGV